MLTVGVQFPSLSQLTASMGLLQQFIIYVSYENFFELPPNNI